MISESSSDELVMTLANGVSHRALYYAEHPQVAGAATEFCSKLTRLLHQAKEGSFFVAVVDDHLVYDDRFLVGPTLLGRRLLDFASHLCCGGFRFDCYLPTEQLLAFFNLSAELMEPVRGLDEARGLLRARGITSIALSPPYGHPDFFGTHLVDKAETSEAGKLPSDPELQAVIPLYQTLVEAVEVAHSRASFGQEIDVDSARSAIEQLLACTAAGFQDILRLVQYPDYESYTIGHSVRVGLLAAVVGSQLKLERDLLIEMCAAGLMYDVGKAKIPNPIWLKNGPLDEEERRAVETHSLVGAQLLVESPSASSLIVDAALSHHKRFDGKGYPDRPEWCTTSPITEILAVCEVFEALTAPRPHKRAWSPLKAYQVMLSDEGAFEPRALAAVVRSLGFFPPGSSVRLSDNRRALVLSAGADPALPRVQIRQTPEGEYLPTREWQELDVADRSTGVYVSELLSETVVVPDPEPALPNVSQVSLPQLPGLSR